jgi:hypothetical protein
MSTKVTILLNGRRLRGVRVMKLAPITSHHEKSRTRSYGNIGTSTNHSYEREPEPVVITDDVANPQTPEKDQPSSDAKMNNRQDKYF